MEKTLKMMESILSGKEKETNEEELLQEYQRNLSPNILAYFYVKNYRLICKISQKYSIITTEDKASFCLQKLDECLRKYNKNQEVKFINYFAKCYENKLLNEIDSIKAKKRNSQEYSDTVVYYDNTDNIDLLLDNYNLTDKEKKQCKLLNMGYSMTEISKILHISISMVSQRNTKIKEKILLLT